MSSTASNLKARIDAVNMRPIYGTQPKDIVSGVFAFAGATTDNATTVADLTGSAAIRSKSIFARLGVTDQADPQLVVVIDEMGLVLHTGVETDLIAEAYARELYIHQKPASDADIYYDLANFLTSISRTGNGVIATGGFGSAMTAPLLHPLETPMIVDLQRDTFEIAPYTAVDGGAALPFTLYCRGHVFHNRDYQRSQWVQSLPDDGSDLHVLQAARAAGRATRRFANGEDVKAVVFHGVDEKGKPAFKRIG